MQAPIEIPNFELLKEIGRGGMARVYLGEQRNPKRKVAIKIVEPSSQQDEDFMQSLKQEGDMAARFSHANIVTVYACGVIEGHYFLAMEFLGGGDLTARIKDGKVDEDDALRIMKEMASALEHAHAQKMLHRDIKPENVMFHESGKAVLVDFGIAKEQDTESNFTKAGAVVGTPHYMAPERATGKPIDQRSDLYALGVMFYEMLTGKKLYEGADTFAISYAHVYEDIPQLPPPYTKYQGLLNRLVAKDPDERFQNATELLAALDGPFEGGVDPASATMVAAGPLTDSATVVAPPSGVHAPAKVAEKKSASGFPLIPVAAGVAVLLAASVAGVIWWEQRAEPPAAASTQVAQGSNQDVARQVEMQDKLAAATAFTRMGRYEDAELNLVDVLTEYDCKNEEARRGLMALNETRARELIAACDG